MADKEIVFSDQERQQIQAILIDKDKDEAIRYLAGLVDRIKVIPAMPAASSRPGGKEGDNRS